MYQTSPTEGMLRYLAEQQRLFRAGGTMGAWTLMVCGTESTDLVDLQVSCYMRNRPKQVSWRPRISRVAQGATVEGQLTSKLQLPQQKQQHRRLLMRSLKG